MVVLCERDASSHPYIDQSVLAMPMCSDYFPLPELDGNFLSENSAAQTTSKKLRKKPLGADYHPSQNAVLCGRGKVCSMSTGNLYLKALVNHYLTPYSNALNKAEKSRIVVAIIDAVHALSGGTFIRFQQGEWWEVDDAFAREKVGHLLLLQQKSNGRTSRLTYVMSFLVRSDPCSVMHFSHNIGQAPKQRWQRRQRRGMPVVKARPLCCQPIRLPIPILFLRNPLSSNKIALF